MNSAKKAGILNWGGWSLIRKSQIVGVLIGALATLFPIIILLCAPAHSTKPMHGDDATALDERSALSVLVALPAILILKAIGCTSLLASNPGTTKWVLGESLVVIVNSLLSFIAGTLVGWLMGKRKVANLALCCMAATSLCLFAPVHCFAHDEHLHMRIPESAFKSSAGLNEFLLDNFGTGNVNGSVYVEFVKENGIWKILEY